MADIYQARWQNALSIANKLNELLELKVLK